MNLKRNGRPDPGVLDVDVREESSTDLDHDITFTPSRRRRPRRTYSEVVEQSATNDRRTRKLLIQTSTARAVLKSYVSLTHVSWFTPTCGQQYVVRRRSSCNCCW